MLKRILRSRRGEGYIDVCVLVLCAMLVIALAVQVLPAFIAKQQLDGQSLGETRTALLREQAEEGLEIRL